MHLDTRQRALKYSLFMLTLMPALSTTQRALANVNTTVSTTAYIHRITYLRGADAAAFYAIFDKDYTSDVITFSCNKQKKLCRIDTRFKGMGGKTAQEFMDTFHIAQGGKPFLFFTADKLFGLSCGHTTVPFCNIYQRKAVLLDAPSARPA